MSFSLNKVGLYGFNISIGFADKETNENRSEEYNQAVANLEGQEEKDFWFNWQKQAEPAGYKIEKRTPESTAGELI